jgi:hypothetical protein
MLRRAVCVLIALALLVPATARAQSGGNDLLPPTAASPTSTPAPTATPTASPDTGTTGRTTLYVIGAGLLICFIGIGLWIARDARRSVRSLDRHGRRSTAEPLPADGAPKPRPPQVKERARAKTKAQRRARRANRPRR